MVKRTGGAGRVRVAALWALALGLAARAEASDLSFTLDPQTGKSLITYGGGASPLVGDGIGVEQVTGLNTPSHGPDTSLQVVDGMLSFQTGAYQGGNSNGPPGHWQFASGGSLSIRGTLPSLGINTDSVLLTGTFSDPTSVRSLNSGTLKVQGGAFFSVVNPTLASYFGLPTGGVLYSGGLSTLFSAEGVSPASFNTGGFTGGTLTLSPVPEPGAAFVFGALAAGGLAWQRRRRV